MKKISSVFDKLQNKHCIAAWSIFHGAILIFFLFTLAVFKGNLSVDSDLFNMLPRPLENESIRDADEKLSEATGQNVTQGARRAIPRRGRGKPGSPVRDDPRRRQGGGQAECNQ